ncbi:MAG: hypothetical protein ABSE77_22520 [Acidimicrobiales bacterium]|jgi:hypothetical protein
MVVSLPCPDTGLRRQAWVALGSPCSSVYVPVLLDLGVPSVLSDRRHWARMAAIRDVVETEAEALEKVRAEFGPLESALWHEADELGGNEELWRAFYADADRKVIVALDRLWDAGIGIGADAP